MKEIKTRFKSKKKIISKRAWLFILIVVSLIVIILCLKVGGVSLPFTDKSSDIPSNSNPANQTETTSEQPSAQPEFNDGTERDPGNTLSEDRGVANISDTNGAASSDTSNRLVSESGEITIFLPAVDSRVGSGQEISGISTLPEISYRVIDNVSGVIATGKLKAVNGRFSGRMTFGTSATEGRIDIFGLREDATEFSNIEIPIRFR